ncbi:putative oxalocrotonate tautomerase enzyme-domain-containing protein [Mycena rosella]|uniref:Oxalocrotonate tautomerase enzyme-domain-containing protein n=1 Tax=Mycena rosella TaxID=1033263 RepID=A0AAD7MAU7_MYCRO|nr:putative oxalocrotonate tautomerase enzyme-domain-containing protein [Mycena rosella]
MPLHRFFTPKGMYSAEDKAAIAAAVTAVYKSLPPFYVVVLFIDLDPESFFVGGKSSNKFLRIAAEHYARNFSDDKAKRGFMDRYEHALEPFTKGRGIDWEVQITDADVRHYLLCPYRILISAFNFAAHTLERERNGSTPGRHGGRTYLETGEPGSTAGGDGGFEVARAEIAGAFAHLYIIVAGEQSVSPAPFYMLKQA